MLPLLLYRRIVQITPENQIGQRLLFVIQGHDRLTDTGVTAIKLKTLFRTVIFDLTHITADTALVSLWKGVDSSAKRGVIFKQMNVPALGVQDIGSQAGEDIEIGDQLQKLFFVK